MPNRKWWFLRKSPHVLKPRQWNYGVLPPPRAGLLFLRFSVEVFPSAFVAFETGNFVQLVGLPVDIVFCDEFHLAGLVVSLSFAGMENGELAPVRLMHGFREVTS